MADDAKLFHLGKLSFGYSKFVNVKGAGTCMRQRAYSTAAVLT